MARIWNHRENKSLDLKLLPPSHLLDDLRIKIYIKEKIATFATKGILVPKV
jgi:hypothetical protein